MSIRKEFQGTSLAAIMQHMEMSAFSPQLATRIQSPPTGREWVHEIKYDGYRMLAAIDRGQVQIISRHGKNWTRCFSPIARMLSSLTARSAVLDGEMVVFAADGRTDFRALQEYARKSTGPSLHYVAFDLLELNGKDLRGEPLLVRKKLLKQLLRKSRLNDTVRYSEHIRGSGEEFFKEVSTLELEGIVSKRVDGTYRPGRTTAWRKCVCVRKEEFIIVGFWRERKQEAVRGLLLGRYSKTGRLKLCGHVGNGMNGREKKELYGCLSLLIRKRSPVPGVGEHFRVIWVRPYLLAQVGYREVLRNGKLRFARYIGLRLDKFALDLKRQAGRT